MQHSQENSLERDKFNKIYWIKGAQRKKAPHTQAECAALRDDHCSYHKPRTINLIGLSYPRRALI